MGIRQQSFLSNLLGENTYEAYKGIAKVIVPIGTCVLLLLYSLSYFVHWGVVRTLIGWCTGYSLLFIVYVAALILLLDVQVDVEEDDYSYGYKKCDTPHKPLLYKLTICWSVILCILGFTAIYFSKGYKEQYAFECRTYLVDRANKIYHIDYKNHCEVAAEAVHLEKMKGYQILETDYEFCEWCQSWEAEALEEYNSTRHVRR